MRNLLMGTVGAICLWLFIPMWIGFGIGGKLFEFAFVDMQTSFSWKYLLILLEIGVVLAVVSVGKTRIKYTIVALSIVLLCFFAFSITMYLLNFEKCNCFGLIGLPPLLVAVIDYGLMLGILIPFLKDVSCPPMYRTNLTSIAIPSIGAVVAIAFSVGLVSGPGAIRIPRTLTVGEEFPWFADVKNGQELEEGIWIVLLSNSDCPKCLLAENSFAVLPTENSKAVIDAKYNGVKARGGAGFDGFRLFSLLSERRWYLDQPIMITLNDGVLETVGPYVVLTEQSRDPVFD